MQRPLGVLKHSQVLRPWRTCKTAIAGTVPRQRRSGKACQCIMLDRQIGLGLSAHLCPLAVCQAGTSSGSPGTKLVPGGTNGAGGCANRLPPPLPLPPLLLLLLLPWRLLLRAFPWLAAEQTSTAMRL